MAFEPIVTTIDPPGVEYINMQVSTIAEDEYRVVVTCPSAPFTALFLPDELTPAQLAALNAMQAAFYDAAMEKMGFPSGP